MLAIIRHPIFTLDKAEAAAQIDIRTGNVIEGSPPHK